TTAFLFALLGGSWPLWDWPDMRGELAKARIVAANARIGMDLRVLIIRLGRFDAVYWPTFARRPELNTPRTMPQNPAQPAGTRYSACWFGWPQQVETAESSAVPTQISRAALA